MIQPAELTTQEQDGGTLVRLSGNMAVSCLGGVPAQLDAIDGPVTAIDLSGVDHIDTIGAWVVHRFAERTGADVEGANEGAGRLIHAVTQFHDPVETRPQRVNPLERVLSEMGAATITAAKTMYGLLGFLGATLMAGWGLIRHPSRFRLNAVVQRFEVVGVSALAIIGLMSFLIGVVIAQQGSVQLKQFGMEVLTINLVGRLTFRELGVLMTAIMVAGRSGSAFAAQLGTMKLTEEVDAMRTIGVAPMEALVLPRILASVVMMPLLGFYASIVAVIGGGFLCAVALEIPPVTFVQRLRDERTFADVDALKAQIDADCRAAERLFGRISL